MVEERDVRPDEVFLYEEPKVKLPKEKFVDVMREIKNLGPKGRPYSWTQLATLTDIKRSTLRSVIRGELSPPRSLVFFEKLLRIPGVTVDHIERLINAADAPNCLAVASRHFRIGEESEHRVEIIADSGVNVLLGVRLDSKGHSEAELSELTGHIRRQVEGTIQMFRDFRVIGMYAVQKAYSDFLREDDK